jgi:hypothetical protein
MAVSSETTSDSPGYFDELAATVEGRGRSRWVLGQVISLADDAPELTDAQLRDRLLALADLVHQPLESAGRVRCAPSRSSLVR